MVEDSPNALADETLGGETSSDGSEAHVELARGEVVGRYVVLERLGMGGMGVVYAAYDPELDRKVALKVLRVSARDPGRARGWLLREAQALAKLSHPSIVTIYDVGVVNHRVWLAMELVIGKTLRAWIAAKRRSWREVLAVLVEAGRGLAAAHSAGLVHRDFKPDNVMVVDDDAADGSGRAARVRVLDFGLARATAEASDAANDGAGARPRIAALHETLTRPGTLPGTPAYMSAEQLGGSTADARSDQFAFCVTTWEALFGRHPFVGDSVVGLAARVLEGNLRTPPSGVRVPAWLRNTLQRGLDPEAGKRWRSMAELLGALERGHTRARLRRGLIGLAAIGVVSTAAAIVHRVDVQQRIDACERAGASIAEVWNEDARARLREALVATHVSHAETTATKVVPWLDAQAVAWDHARAEACLDHDVRHRWDDDMLGRSLWCLDERRMELAALVDELSAGRPDGVRKAVLAASSLPRVEACSDDVALGRVEPPPAEQRDEIGSVSAAVSRVDALISMGATADAMSLARSVRERAEALDWPPLTGAARVREARALELAGDFAAAEEALRRAHVEAAIVGAWSPAADAAIRLVVVLGDRLARPAEAFAWGDQARIALAHADDAQGGREATRLGNVANAHFRVGEPEQAKALFERALAIKAEVVGADHPSFALTLGNLAIVHQALGEHERARLLHERTLAILEEAFGPEHPEVAVVLDHLGIVHQNMGAFARARAFHERAVRIHERASGPAHPDLGTTLDNLANAYYSTGELELARSAYERGIAILERSLGPEHPSVAAGLNGLGNVYEATGEHAKAQAALERALRIYEGVFGPEHPDAATTMRSLAVVHMDRAEHARARELDERALAIGEKVLGPEHPDVAASLAALAAIDVATGDETGAARLLERAVAIYDARSGDETGESSARFLLAKVLVATGGDRERAGVLARQARDAWRSEGMPRAEDLQAVEAWLRELE